MYDVIKMPCETAGVVSRLSTYQEGIETPTGYQN